MYAFIKYRALTVDNKCMPLFIYANPLTVIAETDTTITVQYNGNNHIYEFEKSNIERRF